MCKKLFQSLLGGGKKPPPPPAVTREGGDEGGEAQVLGVGETAGAEARDVNGGRVKLSGRKSGVGGRVAGLSI